MLDPTSPRVFAAVEMCGNVWGSGTGCFDVLTKRNDWSGTKSRTSLVFLQMTREKEINKINGNNGNGGGSVIEDKKGNFKSS